MRANTSFCEAGETLAEGTGWAIRPAPQEIISAKTGYTLTRLVQRSLLLANAEATENSI